MNPIKELHKHGQSVWLDFVARNFIVSGGLQKLIEQDGIRGVTSNPAIFEKAIGGSDEYDTSIRQMLSRGDHPVSDLYEHLAVEDIQHAADVLRPVYKAADGADGFVSLEVSPYLATNTAESTAEAVRLWRAVQRDNLMIKIPATQAGLTTIRELIAEGISVNITLLFSQAMYEEVVEAYISGLEILARKSRDLSRVASVASFFVSRIDAVVDRLLDEAIAQTDTPKKRANLVELKGKVAIANAKCAYQHYKRLFASERWKRLANKGAKVQRLLWASTGTKNKAYSDVLYVDGLIGPDTINTIPPATLDAFRDHGVPQDSLEQNVEAAQAVLDRLKSVAGISLDSVTSQLAQDGVQLFCDSADSLLGAVAQKRAAFSANPINDQSIMLDMALMADTNRVVEEWRVGGITRRLWQRDQTVWTGTDEGQWLGWLRSPNEGLSSLAHYEELRTELVREGFSDAVLLGMGGSSLGAEVLVDALGDASDGLKLHFLDSTDPAQIKAIEAGINPSTALFIVSSKSGSTIEPNMLMAYFLARVADVVGRTKVGGHFVAITDPGTALHKAAERYGFRRTFCGETDIGGRYSVLSPFGLVPAAIAGIDLKRLLTSAQLMVRSCGSDVPPAQNPGVLLGIAIGIAAQRGRDKVTIFASPHLNSFGAWAEQLLAESTGKNGTGLIPIDDEPPGEPSTYGSDRFFIDLRMRGTRAAHDAKLKGLEAAGHPVVRIVLDSVEDIGQEFFRFEIATAVTGAILRVNPFDQPDVESSKEKARELTLAYEETGSFPVDAPVASDGIIDVYADAANAADLRKRGADTTVDSWLRAHFYRLQPGDYAAVLAFVERNPVNAKSLRRLRGTLRDTWRVATCLGFGPRYLHSTGQVYKGGANTGVFLQVTANDRTNVRIPGYAASFGVVKAAQAHADFNVLAERKRRILRVHIKDDVASGLAKVEAAIRGVQT